MVDRIQDLNLPNAVVGRIIKEAIPDGINVSKEARTAISRAASIFIIYLSSSSIAEAKKINHKTISPQDVFAALEEIEFEGFNESLKESLEVFRKNVKDKKDNKQAESKKKEDAAAGDDEVVMVNDDDE